MQIEKLERLIHEQVYKFEPYVHEYNSWIGIACRMATADVSYDCFREVSALYTDKFDENQCSQKWENIGNKCEDKPHDMYHLMNFMKHIGIDV